MKKLLTIIIAMTVSIALFSSLVCSAQYFQSDPNAVAFIKNMYNRQQYTDYSFLRTHCTKKMLKKLEDSFEYECGGTCYATWLFRSGAQDVKYGPNRYYGNGKNESKVLTIVAKDAHWYAYTALDTGWKFTNWVYLIKSGDTFMIDDVITVYSEVDEYLY